MTQIREDREIVLGEGVPPIPERLLLAHGRGEVLFICGAGISKSAGLPDFRELVLSVYQELDSPVHKILVDLPREICNKWGANCSSLNQFQTAEVKRYIAGDYDVVLGMLERRLDGWATGDSQVREKVNDILRARSKKYSDIHRNLMRLSVRGNAITIVTTNFDRLLEAAGGRLRLSPETYSLGGIPRPTKRKDFSGVFHIHGVLATNPKRHSELVLSDQDFGEFYLRRRIVPDFIYDAARLFNLVLVGYSANDPPMRYLLNAVAADGHRFDDLKERFTFFGARTRDPVALEDWKSRGITPIHYHSGNNHAVLHEIFEHWANLSIINGKENAVEKEISRIAKKPRRSATDADRDLFDHFFRRSNGSERIHLSEVASKMKADMEWLDAIVSVNRENAGDATSDF